jgi:hypothetical protein
LGINSNRLFRIFKYAVYAFLAFNVYVFWSEEVLSAALQFPDGMGPSQIIGSYPATIDTAAWVVLLLIFELETYVLDDEQYTPALTRTLQGIRLVCYAFVFYALYGYIVKLAFVYQTVQFVGLSDLCSLVANGWSYAVDLDEYQQLTLANCATISDATAFSRFEGLPAVVDQTGLTDIHYLAWVDVLNASGWVLVVFVLEADVWLQERSRYVGAALRTSQTIKFVLYSVLLLALFFWAVKGDFVDYWDSALWLLAFVFIELNVFEWRQEAKETVIHSPIS